MLLGKCKTALRKYPVKRKAAIQVDTALKTNAGNMSFKHKKVLERWAEHIGDISLIQDLHSKNPKQ